MPPTMAPTRPTAGETTALADDSFDFDFDLDLRIEPRRLVDIENTNPSGQTPGSCYPFNCSAKRSLSCRQTSAIGPGACLPCC